MQIQRGRLIDHLHLKVRDLAASRRFYGAVLGVLGIAITDGDGYFYADELWVDEGTPGQITHAHFAFQAKDRDTVEAFYKAGLAADGRDNGGPGERTYHPGYYAAFLLDPDGNNVEAVYHGPHQRSSEAVVISW
ncbi:glyoxalase/bleomycin resistance protein/ring-cleaving dioxygenase [Cupriavidus gilardii CR3]|uniref:VOC family protein n=1 Tax=Cupriavidus gilardii TaxID=82541 RepID=A0A849BS45_9BURK|nr:VOC family protein [Cupriavidus gilardii]ALD91025.1 glyoxalase/bleomycin resistance protein/ring-cleaving dioxygenase [Cupriavidus gilardii CR3]QQE06060.1 VOC family protein [Cupriavidus sp. ISTL7]KAB0596303.1 VOC family protein [Cupriavidus gilardii]MCT9012196.1 VOC family protein [Cupriavidus gilardii]MCT9053667.1 VOC family protein [Cupriavidus gilardii]